MVEGPIDAPSQAGAHRKRRNQFRRKTEGDAQRRRRRSFRPLRMPLFGLVYTLTQALEIVRLGRRHAIGSQSTVDCFATRFESGRTIGAGQKTVKRAQIDATPWNVWVNR
jgi:hypothetical protein